MRSCCKFVLVRPVSRPLILEYRRFVPAFLEELHELDLATEELGFLPVSEELIPLLVILQNVYMTFLPQST